MSCSNCEGTHWARTWIVDFFGNCTPKISRSYIATTTYRQRVVDLLQNLSRSSTAELVATAVVKIMLAMCLNPLRNRVQHVTFLGSSKKKDQNIACTVLKDGMELRKVHSTNPYSMENIGYSR